MAGGEALIMLIIHNRFIPFGKSYIAINLFGIVFAKRQLSECDKRHEQIHTWQQQELLFVGFYLWYLVEWVVLLLRYRNQHKAYRNIRFEREAFDHEHDKSYPKTRKHYAWLTFK